MVRRVALIGCGVMGRNHARTLISIPEVEISHIIDNEIEAARDVALEYGQYGAVVGTTIEPLSKSNTDAVIVASPSHFHAEQTIAMMESGLDVLVEKPIALSVEDAEAMKEVARCTGRVLMAGHVELFNPVVSEMRSLLVDENLRTLRFKRLGAVSDKSRLKHEVVSDLMLHDIAIANQIVDPCSNIEPIVVSSFGRRDTAAYPDPVEVLIDYGNGIDAHFRASRAYSGGKVRSIEAEIDTGVISANLLTKEIVRKSAEEGVITPDGTLVQDVRSSLFFAQDSSQPLQLEQQHFLRCISGNATPEDANVSVDDAIRILRLVDTILVQLVMSKNK